MAKLVCIDCLVDSFLQDKYEDNDVEECDYCSRERPVVDLDAILSECQDAIWSSFAYAEQPGSVIHHGHPPVGCSLYDVIETILGAEDTSLLEDLAAEMLEGWIEENNVDDPSFIEETYASAQMASDWLKMQQSLQFESRLVNPIVGLVLERIFSGIDRLHTATGSQSAITIAGPGQLLDSFQRARSFQSEEGLTLALKHPEKHLGPPPRGKGSAGRMNAVGISVFYGATNDETAIAEVRPPVGSWVVSATFEIIRPLRLLNLNDLGGIRPDGALSYFDPIRREQAQRCAFLRELQQQMLMPVMPESADQGYLITQAIADFLATSESLNLDGILFPSVQGTPGKSPGHNVILFHKASSVEKTANHEALENVELRELDEDRWRFYPQIWEAGPSPYDSQPSSVSYAQIHNPCLKLNRDRIAIHKIQGVSFSFETDRVHYVPWTDGHRYYGPR
ncbi:RES family NAD+ phosphorylase [Pseudomonas syringae]|nr:RES family NAD+ phosphorylase [Pseudomonas syringae]